MKYPLKLANVSDIHLGHPETKTTSIIENLEKAFPNDSKTGELDLILITGDVFDRLLTVPDDNVSAIKLWIYHFLKMCSKHNIVIRVLEGTPCHDWGQPKMFMEIKEISGLNVDLKYHNKLEVDYIESLDINVLYIPDEWNPETDDTWVEAETAVKKAKIGKVDFVAMHGCFHYQLPEFINGPKHVESRYLSITNHFIFNGHVHRHSQYERILVPGSFDRLCHGEEEEKGHLRVTVKAPDDSEIVFVPNHSARKYVSVECHGLEPEKAIDKIRERLVDLPKYSSIRIVSNRNDPVIDSLKMLKDQYPHFTWCTKISTESQNVKDTLVDKRLTFKGVDITKDNIADLLLDRLKKDVDNKELLKHCKELLNQVI